MREILFKAKRTDNGEWVEGYIVKCPCAVQIGNGSCWYINVPPVDPDDNGGRYNVNPETVCQYTGKKILQNQVTGKSPQTISVWYDDLIAIYTIYYDDFGQPVRNKIAVVRVEFDEKYQIPYARCVFGTMEEVISECDIPYMDGYEDWPFTFWLEYMENGQKQFWEWEVIGNAHDQEE